MGATSFMSVATGKTVQEAFAAARERALYDHGHSGYSGTIAEKSNFVLVPTPIRKAAAFETALEDLSCDERYWLREAVKEAKRNVLEKKRGSVGALRKAERELVKSEKERERKLKKLGPLAALVEKYLPTWYDKWGPAVAFEVVGVEATRMIQNGYVAGVVSEHKDGRRVYRKTRGHKVFVFCGLASC